MHRHPAGCICACFIALLSLPSLAAAAGVHWNNAAGGNWNVAANWLPAAVPTPSDTAVIDLAGTYTVTIDVNPSLAALRISGAAIGVQTVTGTSHTVTLANASSIGAQGVLSLASSTVNGAGALTNEGTLTVTGVSSLAGTFSNAAGAMLRVQGTAANSSLTVANGFANGGAIELTSLGGVGAATLSVTAGTLTNAAAGTISSLAGSGGARNLTAELNNQGLITVAANLTTNRGTTDHVNAGTIDLTTGNYTIVLSGTTPSFTTTGTINVPAGRTLTLQGNISGGTGQLYNYNGGTMGGAGTVSVLNSTLVLGQAMATSATHLDANTCTINGPGTLTVSAGTTFNATSSTLNAPLVVASGGTLQLVSSDQLGTLTNGGLVEVTGVSTSNGLITTQSGSTLRVLGTASNTGFTVASGFTNSAGIELTSLGGVGAATLSVTAGTLTNAAAGTISSLAGSGGARNLTAELNNQGLITVAANLTTNRGTTDHVNAGTIDLTTGNYTIVLSGTTPSFTTTGTINVPAGRTLTLQGNISGGTGQLYNYNGGTMGGAGTVSVLNSTLVLGQAMATSATHLDANTCTINGPGTLTVSAGTTFNATSSTLNAPLVVASGGTLQLVSSDQLGTLTNGGLVEVTGVSTSNGLITTQSGSTLRVLGTASNTGFTVANGFTNSAGIELTSLGGVGAATLSVTAGTLTNAAAGTISSLAGSGGARNLTAEFNNQGLFTVAANLTTNRGTTDHVNAGTIDLTTGNYTIVLSGTTPSFTTTGTINVPSGRTLTLQGNISGGTGQLYNFNGGTMGGAGTVSVLNSTLVLGAAMATSATHLDANTCTINGPGTLTVSAGTTFNATGSTLNAPLVVASGGTLQLASSDQLGTLTNGGLVEVTGASTSNGLITTQSGSTLRVLGTASNTALTVASGFTNSAGIELTSLGGVGAATLSVTAGTLTNAAAGTISSLAGSGGARNLTAEFNNQGLITVAANLTTNRGTSDHVNAGTIDLTTGNYTIVLSGTTPSFTTTGTINVPAGRTLTLQGNISGGTGQLYNYNGGTMGGAGTVSVLNSTLVLGVGLATSMAHLTGSTATLDGPGTLTVSASTSPKFTSCTLNAPIAVASGGTLQLVSSDQLGTLTNGGLVEVTGASTSNGLITTQPGSTLRVLGTAANSSFTVATGFTNSAGIELSSLGGAGAATLTVTGGALVNAAAGSVSAVPGSGGARQLLAQLQNNGLLDVQANLTLSKAAVIHSNAGTLSIAATRTLTVTGTALTNLPAGVIQGSGILTLSGATTLAQQGAIRPGASPGALRINGAMPCAVSASLDVEIGGDVPGTGYDQLNVRDGVTLGGTLNISVVGGYQPVPGRRYVISTFASRTGTFGTVNGLGYGVGQMWVVTYSDSDVVLLAMDQTWSRAFPDGTPPTPRDGHTAVYDSTGDRMTVFGGQTDAGVVNEAWVLSKAVGVNYPAWTKLTPSGSPPAARKNASAVYDPASNHMIVFGGDDGAGTPSTFGDVRVLTSANGLGGAAGWTALSPTGTPPVARSGHAAAYDALHDRMIVMGGDSAPGVCGGELADVWVLDHASGLGGTPAWTQLAPTGTPPSPRANHGAAYDAASGRLIVVGGDACGVSNSETWVLDNANGLGGTPAWSQLTPAQPAPAGWSLARYAYDASYQWLDAFGGKVGATLVDTAFTLTAPAGGGGTSWYRRLGYGTRPNPRTSHSMIMASLTHTAVVFGGLTASGRTNDVWRRMVDRGPVLAVNPPVVVPQRTAFAIPPSPNPARGAVSMAVDVAREQRVDLAVFDLGGRRVATLHVGLLPVGRHTFEWGGNALPARTVAPGVYLVRLSSEERTQVARVVRL